MTAKPERPWQIVNEIMARASFDYDLTWASHVWAARRRECPTCLAPPNSQCRNMTDVKRGELVIRGNKWPHPARVDYDLLEQALRGKGYN